MVSGEGGGAARSSSPSASTRRSSATVRAPSSSSPPFVSTSPPNRCHPHPRACIASRNHLALDSQSPDPVSSSPRRASSGRRRAALTAPLPRPISTCSSPLVAAAAVPLPAGAPCCQCRRALFAHAGFGERRHLRPSGSSSGGTEEPPVPVRTA